MLWVGERENQLTKWLFFLKGDDLQSEGSFVNSSEHKDAGRYCVSRESNRNHKRILMSMPSVSL